jgi:FtsH-binding integral membrane protein
VGLAIPSLLAAGSAALTPARFGTGSGILNTARQVGTVLGVAGLVAILTHVSRADPIASYRHGLILIVAFFAAAGVIAAALLTRRPSVSAAPAPAALGSREPATQVVTGGGS